MEELPLKVFVYDEITGSPFTGYYVKPKNKYYYKARDKGAAVNISAGHLNKKFEVLLQSFEYDKQYEKILREKLIEKLEGYFSNQIDTNKSNKARITEISNQLEAAEERLCWDKLIRNSMKNLEPNTHLKEINWPKNWKKI